MSDDTVDLREFLSGFVAEADDHLRSCRSALVALDRVAGRPEPNAVRQMYRSLHTVKGLAAMVGVQAVVDLAHRLETVVRTADQVGGALAPEAIDPLMRGLSGLELRVQALARGEEVPEAPARLMSELEHLEPSVGPREVQQDLRLFLPPELARKLTGAERAQIAEAARTGRRVLRVDFVPTPARAAAGVNITAVREALARVGELVRVLPRSVPASEDAPGGLSFALLFVTDLSDEEIARRTSFGSDAVIEPLVELDAPVGSRAAEPEARADEGDMGRGVVRVDVERLNAAMQSLSSLVVTRFKLSRAIAALEASGVDVRELRVVNDEHTRQLRAMRESILHLRMVPVAELLERIPLIVRALRSATGKAVQVHVEGARAELDKSVAEKVFPALVHLVRNAVDHGIEPPEVRRALGKPPEGALRITVAEPAGDRLSIGVSDDGAGIDASAVARRTGRPVPADDRGLLELLALPGLSTRDEATHTSGRGMGLDIVQRIATRELGGELSLRNEPGAGTSFTMSIPLTVSIVDSLSFECGEQVLVAPLGNIEEVVDASELRVAETPGSSRMKGQRIIERRGEVAPFFSLGEVLGFDARDEGKAVLVRRDGTSYAFAVDRVLGRQEVVVRPLLDPLVQVVGLTGSTDLGDGRPTLVLDLAALGDDLERSWPSLRP